MCGRYVCPDEAAMQRAWQIGRDAPNPLADLKPIRRRFNVLPTTAVPILRRDRDSAQLLLAQARWGLIPFWWKDKKLPRFTINARSPRFGSARLAQRFVAVFRIIADLFDTLPAAVRGRVARREERDAIACAH